MSNDKTLATAKHGGCVQLSTSERERFEAWAKHRVSSMARAADGEYVSSFTHALWCAWQAALSAQPSPGGQGDALVTDAMVEVAHSAYWAHPDDSGEDRPCMRAALKAALAARQPVGESMAVCKTCGGSGYVDDGEIDCYPDGTPYLCGPVKCVKDCPTCSARPAQTVDLGKLLPAVRMLVVSARTSGGTAGHDAHLCEALDRVEALLPKVDSQAVGK